MPAIFSNGHKVKFGLSGIEGFIIQSFSITKKAAIDTSIPDEFSRKRVRVFDDIEQEAKVEMIFAGGAIPEIGDYFEYEVLNQKTVWIVVSVEQVLTNNSLLKVMLTLNHHEYIV